MYMPRELKIFISSKKLTQNNMVHKRLIRFLSLFSHVVRGYLTRHRSNCCQRNLKS